MKNERTERTMEPRERSFAKTIERIRPNRRPTSRCSGLMPLNLALKTWIFGIFLKFDHPIYKNDASPFEKGGNPFDFSCD
jgi:hypothetical protein